MHKFKEGEGICIRKKINSLVDFISVINDTSQNKIEHFYRGESELFQTPLLANGYRSRNSWTNLRFLKKELFRKVGFSLDEDSRKNCTA